MKLCRNLASLNMKFPSDEVGDRGRRRGQVMQVITMMALAMNFVILNTSIAFNGVFTEQMTSPDADVTLSVSEISWVCSISSIGNMIGFLASSYVNPMFGAIRVCQLCAPMVAAGFVIVALGKDFWTLFAGQLLLGIFNGITNGPSNTQIGEISSPELRGFFTSAMTLIAMCCGITCSYLTGWLIGWRKMCLVMGITPMVFMFVVTLMLPRSPRWLITKGHPVEEAERSLRFYFGQDHDVDKVVKGIQESLGDGHKHDASFLQVLSRLRHRHNMVPFLLVIAVHGFMAFSGGYASTAFAPVIFKEVGGFSNPYIGSILVGVVRIIAAIICSGVINRVHRRTLLMVNGIIGGVGCLFAGCYFFYIDQLSDYAWISLVSIFSIVFSMSLGVSPMKNVLFGELLPNSIRSEVGGICLALFGTANFVMVYTFPLAKQAMGMSGVYWFFTLMHLLLFVFSLFCLPDTNGKTIEDIQKMFVKNVTNAVSEPVDVHVVENGKGNLDVIALQTDSPHGGVKGSCLPKKTIQKLFAKNVANSSASNVDTQADKEVTTSVYVVEESKGNLGGVILRVDSSHGGVKQPSEKYETTISYF